MTNKPILPFLILLFITCFLEQTPAQTPSGDSLRLVLNAYVIPAGLTPADTAYLSLADALCNQYFKDFELDSLRAVSDRALNLFPRFKAAGKELLARLDYYKMRFYRFKGMAYIQSGDYPNALSAYQQYAVQAEKIGSVKDMGNSYTYIGYCHRELEDFNLAYQYAQKSLAILKDTPYKSALANNYSIYSSYYYSVLLDIDSSNYFLKLAQKIYREEKNVVNEAVVMFGLATNFNYLYQTDSALFYLNLVKPFVFSQGSAEMVTQYHMRLGESLYIKGQNKQALHHLRIGSKMAADIQNPKFSYIANKFLALALAADGQPQAAITCMEDAASGFATNINSSKIRELNTAQLNFEFEKKQALADLELERQKRVRDLSLVGLLLGLLVALLLFRLYRQSKNTSRILAEKNRKIERSYQELKETQAQLVLTEKQREAQSIRVHIARDIHDELGAGLTKITMMSDVVRRKLAPENTESAQMLQRIVENSKAVTTALSEIVWAVNPSHDTLESLSNYLKNYAAHYLDGTGVQGIFDFPTQVPNRAIEPELKRNIFLVLKEALNNAVKYAGTDTIWVSFNTDGRDFKLSIVDKGKGFNPAETTQNNGNGNGLLNMKSRMEQVGCTLDIQSAVGDGCRIEASGKLM